MKAYQKLLVGVGLFLGIFAVANGASVFQVFQGGLGFSSARQGELLTGSADHTQTISKIATGSAGQVLTMSGGLPAWLNPATSGTVTSVDQTVPTGFSVSGNPITGAGTLAITYAAGYSLPLTASQSAWESFYDTPSTRITAGTNLAWSGNTLNGTTSPFRGIGFGTIGGSFSHITSISYDDGGFNLSNTASQGFVRLDYANGPASRSIAQTISGQWLFSAAPLGFTVTNNASISGNFEVTGNSGLGGDGGVYIQSVGTGNGTIGFNSGANFNGVNYAAGVTGAGFLFQYTNSDSTTRFFNESSVTAGSGHAHTQVLQINPGSQGATLSVPFEVTKYASLSNSLYAATNGRVAIGNNIPNGNLDIQNTAIDELVFSGDNSTGIYQSFPGDSLYMSTNAGLMTFDTDHGSSPHLTIGIGGNVGVGTASPNALLNVDGNNSTLFNVSSNSVSKFTVLENGNVGIASLSAKAKLGIVGTAGQGPILSIASSSGVPLLKLLKNGNLALGNNPVFPNIGGSFGMIASGNSSFGSRVTNTSTSTGAYAVAQFVNDTGNGAGFFMNSSLNTTYAGASSLNLINTATNGALSLGTNNLSRFYVGFTGLTGIASSSPQSMLDIATSANTNPLSIASSSGTTLLKLNKSGQLGVGHSPAYALDVKGINASLFHLGQADDSGMYFLSNAANQGLFAAGGTFVSPNWIAKSTSFASICMGLCFGNNDISFASNAGLTSGNSFSPTTRMIIDSTGNLGLNTTGPTSMLDIVTNATVNPLKIASSSAGTMLILTKGNNLGLGGTPENFTSLGFTTLTINNSVNGGVLDLDNNGTRVGTFFTNSSQAVNIGNITNNGINFLTNALTRMTLDNLGNASVSGNFEATYPNAPLTEDAACISAGGVLSKNAGATTCLVSSEKYKHDIQPLNVGLDTLMKLKPVSFVPNGPASSSRESLGFIAEDVNQVEPRLVFYEPGTTNPRGVKYEEMTALDTKAIQELKAKNDALEARVTALEARVGALDGKTPSKPSAVLPIASALALGGAAFVAIKKNNHE